MNKKLIRTLAAGMAVLMISGAVAFGATAEDNTDAKFTLQTVESTEQQETLTIKEVAKKCIPSIVSINTETTVTYYNNNYSNPFGGFGYGFGYGYGYGQGGQQKQEVVQKAAGTGIIASADGYIITNNHVIEGADIIKVTLSDEETEYEAKLVGASADNDIAVLKVDAKGLTPAVFGDSETMEIGDEVVAIGNALGKLSSTVTHGIISSTAREITIDDVTIKALQTDAAVNSGNSGGALINMQGEVIGVVYAKSNDMISDGIAYAIPVSEIKDLVENMVNDPESVAAQTAGTQIMLGISYLEITDEMQQAYSLPAGLYVTEVSNFSAAERAGLQKADIIISFAGQDVTSKDEIDAIKGQQTPGDEVEMVVNRNGREVKLTIVIPQPTAVETVQ